MSQEQAIQQMKDLKNTYSRFSESEDGKVILEDLRKYCFVNQTTFNENAYKMAFNEGTRAIWLFIERRIKPIEPTKGE